MLNPPHNSVLIPVRPGRDGQGELLLLKCLHVVPLPEEEVRYKPPGGAAEKGETPEQTARRELREESGLKAKTNAALREAYKQGEPPHVKYGFWVERSECKGRLYRGVHSDRKTRFVGYEWMTFERALELVPPSGEEASHHLIIAAVRDGYRAYLRSKAAES